MEVTSPLPGTVLRINVTIGERVNKDQPLLSLFSMKTEIEVPSPTSGAIKVIKVKEGDEVEIGQTLAEIE